MSACEQCWTEAQWRAARSFETTPEIYQRLIAENWCEQVPPTTTDSED